MSKEVDFPIAHLYKNILIGCFVFVPLGFFSAFDFYASANPVFFSLSFISNLLAFMVGILALAFIRKNKAESRLPNYLAFVFSTSLLLFVFFR